MYDTMNMITNTILGMTSGASITSVLSTASVNETMSVVQDYGADIANSLLVTNNVWMMVATFLVFIMHLGFAGVEAGFTTY